MDKSFIQGKLTETQLLTKGYLSKKNQEYGDPIPLAPPGTGWQK